MRELKLDGEPVVLLTKKSWVALCETLRDIVSRADASEYAREQYVEFVEQARYDNKI